MPKHKLTKEQRLTILNDYNINRDPSRIARQYGISPQYVTYLYAQSIKKKDIRLLLEKQKRKTLAIIWDSILPKILDAIANQEKIDKASLRDLTVTMGILVEKGLLLQGEATSIQKTVISNPDELRKEILYYLKKRNQRFGRVIDVTPEREGDKHDK